MTIAQSSSSSWLNCFSNLQRFAIFFSLSVSTNMVIYKAQPMRCCTYVCVCVHRNRYWSQTEKKLAIIIYLTNTTQEKNEKPTFIQCGHIHKLQLQIILHCWEETIGCGLIVHLRIVGGVLLKGKIILLLFIITRYMHPHSNNSRLLLRYIVAH